MLRSRCTMKEAQDGQGRGREERPRSMVGGIFRRYGIFDRTISSLGRPVEPERRVLRLYHYKIYNGLVYVYLLYKWGIVS